MEKSQYLTFSWIFGLGLSFLLWELGVQISNRAWQALAGVIVGLVGGYIFCIRFKKQDKS